MIDRVIAPHLVRLAGLYPVLTVTGPRQSGKTTLCKSLFPEHTYRSLEDPDIRRWASDDPRGFLEHHSGGLIIDEAQRVSDLFSYIQGRVDENRKPGQYVVTGSAQFQLLESVTQSLAGRTALATLLPLSLQELRQAGIREEVNQLLVKGFYPQAYHQGIDASELLGFYSSTYLERDVRQLLNVRDLSTFQTFLRLCAGRTGQVLNLASLARDAGVSHATAGAWLSILQASYVVFLVRPYHSNLSKRLVKAPKLHFWDVGLACNLLGIRNPQEVAFHPLRGALFESLVVGDVAKRFTNQVVEPRLYHYREASGAETDLVVEVGGRYTPIEIKASVTLPNAGHKGLAAFAKSEPNAVLPTVVYAGNESMQSNGTRLASFRDIASLF